MMKRLIISFLLWGLLLIGCAPKAYRVHYDIGLGLIGRGDYEKAKREFHEAIRLKPKYIEAYTSLGLTLVSQDQYQSAEHMLREVVRWNPKDPEPHYQLGNVFRLKGEYQAAEREFREAIRLKPGDLYAHYYLAVALVEQGRHKEASESIRRTDTNNAFLYYNRAWLNLSDNDIEEALKSLGKAIEKGFNNWPWIEKDRELVKIKGDPRFIDIIEQVRKQWAAKQKQDKGWKR